MDGIGKLQASAALRVRQEIFHGGADRGVRKFGLPADDLHDRPGAPDVGKPDKQRGLRLHAAQEPHGLRVVPCRRDRTRVLRENFVEAVVGIAREQRRQPLRLQPRQIPEIRRPFHQCGEQRAHRWIFGNELPERFAGRGIRDLVEPCRQPRKSVIGGKQGGRAGDALGKRNRHGAVGIG